MLVDTHGLMLKAKVYSAKVMDYEGIKMLLQRADIEFSRLSKLLLDALATGESTQGQGLGRERTLWAEQWTKVGV